MGISNSLSATVKTNNILVGAAIIATFVIIGLVVGIFLWLYMKPPESNTKLNPEQVTDAFSVSQGNYGGVREMFFPVPASGDHVNGSGLSEFFCNSRQNAFMRNGECRCMTRWYGNRCNMQKFPRTYINMGQIDLDDINSECDKHEGESVNWKAFTEDSCSYQCDEDDECTGFWYDKEQGCYLFHGLIELDAVPRYELEEESNLYVKDVNDIVTPVIYLSSNHLRPWAGEERSEDGRLRVQKIDFGRSYKVMIPINDGIRYTGPVDTVGLWTNYPLTLKEYDEGIITSSTVYVHHGDEVLDIPLDMRVMDLYVIYFETDGDDSGNDGGCSWTSRDTRSCSTC